MFCPFAKEECRMDCAFHCKHEETITELTQSYTSCLIIKRLNSINYMQVSQLNDITKALTNDE